MKDNNKDRLYDNMTLEEVLKKHPEAMDLLMFVMAHSFGDDPFYHQYVLEKILKKRIDENDIEQTNNNDGGEND